MARAIREYQIRPMVCDWALDIPMGNTTFVLHFNSRNNAELVKAILEWEDSHPNEAIPYQPTLTPPNEPLTCEGCYYIKNDDYPPCAWCIRSKENEDYYHCPPESEAALRREQDG